MKKFSQGVALVAVTTLFATAFTTSHWDNRSAERLTPASTNQVAQVVITGKRMTALEKAQYDAELLAQKSAPAVQEQPERDSLAVK